MQWVAQIWIMVHPLRESFLEGTHNVALGCTHTHTHTKSDGGTWNLFSWYLSLRREAGVIVRLSVPESICCQKWGFKRRSPIRQALCLKQAETLRLRSDGHASAGISLDSLDAVYWQKFCIMMDEVQKSNTIHTSLLIPLSHQWIIRPVLPHSVTCLLLTAITST